MSVSFVLFSTAIQTPNETLLETPVKQAGYRLLAQDVKEHRTSREGRTRRLACVLSVVNSITCSTPRLLRASVRSTRHIDSSEAERVDNFTTKTPKRAGACVTAGVSHARSLIANLTYTFRLAATRVAIVMAVCSAHSGVFKCAEHTPTSIATREAKRERVDHFTTKIQSCGACGHLCRVFHTLGGALGVVIYTFRLAAARVANPIVVCSAHSDQNYYENN